MKLVILEPLGVPKESLLGLAAQMLGEQVEIIYYDSRPQDAAELVQRSHDADAVLLANLPFRKEAIVQCPKLKFICVAFTGVDHVDISCCKARGITVSNCAGYSTAAVADLVFGMVIALYRNLIPCDQAVRSGMTKDGLVGFELEGKRFGIVGAGAIGLRVAKIAQVFGCEVCAYSRTPKPQAGIPFVSLEELLSGCDIISLHVPHTPDTAGLISREKLSLVKPGAILINTARGPVVDSLALADALKAGRLAGAGIDVFEMEPPIPSDHPLLHAPNLLLTPHVGFATHQAMEKRAVIAFENIKKWLAGQPQNVVC